MPCSGLAPNTREADWLAIAGDNEKLRTGMARLYQLFKDAPVLGSLINPRSTEGHLPLLDAAFHELQPLLEKALAQETKDDTAHEMAVTARGLAKAAEILAGQFTLIATNVPYLGRGKQDEVLQDYCERVHPDAKSDLATCFVERCLDFCAISGSTALVTPQNWLFLQSYMRLRKSLLSRSKWTAIVGLGSGAFETIGGEVVNVFLLGICKQMPATDAESLVIDAGGYKSARDKAIALCGGQFALISQSAQLTNPDARISLTRASNLPLLEKYSYAYHGLTSGDGPRMIRKFWEFPEKPKAWIDQRTTVDATVYFGGASEVLFWNNESGPINELLGARKDGQGAWGKRGIVVKQMTNLSCSLYFGESFDNNTATIVPFKIEHLPAIWAFCSSQDFHNEVRKIDRKLSVTSATLVKVPFDLAHWQKVAAEKYPHGLPKPFSSDPTQWLFNGHPAGADQPLHVAVARLLGYRWPRQTGSSFPDCPALGPDGLEKHADKDGVVCFSQARDEAPAATRLRALLADAYGAEWSHAMERKLIAASGSKADSLEDWLLNDFFAQHCDLFHNRPFIWHLWDGRKDGFNVLVNYHRLAAKAESGKQKAEGEHRTSNIEHPTSNEGGDGESHAGLRTLESLTFAYLGDWIGRQRDAVKREEAGAEDRLAAALELQGELKKIVAGEPPYDLFIRWKALACQPIGWTPDINDGVRLNCRPFLAATLSRGKKGAGLFRAKPGTSLKWDKDRGNEPHRSKEDYPWFWSWDKQSVDFKGNGEFDGNRWNDCHYTTAFKKAARERKRKK